MTENATDNGLHALLFGVRRSVRYHMRRESFFEAWHRTTSALSVIFGSAVIASLLTDISSMLAVFAAGLVTIFSAIDLVVGTSHKARIHNDLRRRFLELEKTLHNLDDSDTDAISAATQTRLDIEADEPPPLRALDSICHNDQLRAQGYKQDSGEYVPLSRSQRFTAHFINWPIAK